MECKKCGVEVGKGVGDGLCVKCYNLDLEQRNSAICKGCGEYKPIRARGYCRKCYCRVQRHDDAGLVRDRKVKPSLCAYCGENVVHAKGLCRACYNRFRKSGTAKHKEISEYIYSFDKKDCVACGKEFQPVRKNQNHCTRRCYDKDKRRKSPIIKTCKNDACGKEFATASTLKVFCSEECKIQFHNADRSTRESGTKLCEICGANFVTATYHGKFCSKECQQKSEPVSEGKRKYSLKSKFNITRKEYKRMLEAQKGVCFICGNKEVWKVNGKVKNLAVDHDHESGKIRGLLCQRCNQGLGHFQDDTDRMQSAINYLKSHASSEA